MHFTKEIFSNSVSDWIHPVFVRYGKGTFNGPVLRLNKGKGIKVKGSIDYCNTLGYIIANSANANLEINGKIIAKRDFSNDLRGIVNLKKFSKEGGLFSAEITDMISSKNLKNIYEKIPDAYVLIDISANPFKLKSKKSLPKPGSRIDGEFCNATLDMSALDSIMSELLFDLKNKDFNEVNVSHTYTINELVAPEEIKKDPARFRIEAKRKGTIKRILEVDGQKTESEHELLV